MLRLLEGLPLSAGLQRAMDFLWKAWILPWIAGYAVNPQAPPTFPQETATSGRPSGPHPQPFGWKAASHLSTVLGFRFAKPTLNESHQQLPFEVKKKVSKIINNTAHGSK